MSQRPKAQRDEVSVPIGEPHGMAVAHLSRPVRATRRASSVPPAHALPPQLLIAASARLQLLPDHHPQAAAYPAPQFGQHRVALGRAETRQPTPQVTPYPSRGASFRRRLATTPLRLAHPSPPSGWVEDSHLQATKHVRHTGAPATAARSQVGRRAHPATMVRWHAQTGRQSPDGALAARGRAPFHRSPKPEARRRSTEARSRPPSPYPAASAFACSSSISSASRSIRCGIGSFCGHFSTHVLHAVHLPRSTRPW